MPGMRQEVLEGAAARRVYKKNVFRGMCFEEGSVMMNRMQRRKLSTGGFSGAQIPKHLTPYPPKLQKDDQPDFLNVPIDTMCRSIRLLIDEFRSRGYPVYDFDHKGKSVQSIQIIRGKVYFMAAEEAETDGKAQAENE